MRQHKDVFLRRKGRVAAGFGHKAIQPRRRHMARLQRRQQGRLIHQSPPRRVHHNRAFGQKRKAFGVQQALGCGRGRAMQRQEIGYTQQAFHRGVIGCPLRQIVGHRVPVVIMDLHLKPARLAGESLPHAPHPDDPQPRARDLLAHHERRRPEIPSAGPHDAIPGHGMTRSPQHQKHRDFRRGI